MQDDWAKQEIMRAYFKKKNLNLKDIGFKTGSRIFINERLTSTNREIFNRASEAKKFKFIHRFYTRRGLVYMQRRENDRPTCAFHIRDLDDVFPPDYDRHRRTDHQQWTNDPLDKSSTNMPQIPLPNLNSASVQSTDSKENRQPSTSQSDIAHANPHSHVTATTNTSQANM